MMNRITQMTRTILLTVSYSGTFFAGWQKQETKNMLKTRTVQDELEKALEVLHKHPVQAAGSGRTDSGVHAVGQKVTFATDIQNMEVRRFIPALNSILCKDIRIMDAKEVPNGFHARFNATGRTYRYFIHCGKMPYAHELPFVWSIRRFPDLAVLNRMASFLHGETDCTTFTASGDKSSSRCRYISSAVFFMDGEKLIFEISANAFLWKMVRSIVGTLLFFEYKKYDWQYFGEILHKKERSLAGPTAPSEGLFLWNVSYEGERFGHAPLNGGTSFIA